jgi:hypothetical protein
MARDKVVTVRYTKDERDEVERLRGNETVSDYIRRRSLTKREK